MSNHHYLEVIMVHYQKTSMGLNLLSRHNLYLGSSNKKLPSNFTDDIELGFVIMEDGKTHQHVRPGRKYSRVCKDNGEVREYH